jgi:hypothetical protein
MSYDDVPGNRYIREKEMFLDRMIQERAVTKNQVRQELGLHPTDESWGNDIAGDPMPEGV